MQSTPPAISTAIRALCRELVTDPEPRFLAVAPLAEAYKFAGDTMAANMMEPDAIEGIDAFIAKRDPSWKR